MQFARLRAIFAFTGLFQNWAGLVLAGESLRVVGGRDGWELAFA
jgi:hypothetical protein